MKWWEQMPWSQFFEWWVLNQLFHPPFSPSFFTFIKKLFSSSSLSDIKVVSSAWVSSNQTAAAAAAKSHQSFPTLYDPIDCNPTGSSGPGIFQARILEWVTISFSSAWKWKVKVKSLSRVQLLATPWTVAHQAPPSMGFSRQEYWSGVPLPSPQIRLMA